MIKWMMINVDAQKAMYMGIPIRLRNNVCSTDHG